MGGGGGGGGAVGLNHVSLSLYFYNLLKRGLNTGKNVSKPSCLCLHTHITLYWVAVKEFKLSCYIGETLFIIIFMYIYIYVHYGKFN